jgi:hypothetical protein
LTVADISVLSAQAEVETALVAVLAALDTAQSAVGASALSARGDIEAFK